MSSKQTQLFPPPTRSHAVDDKGYLAVPLRQWLFTVQNLLPLRVGDTSGGPITEALPPAGLNSTTGQSNQNQEILYIKSSADANAWTITGAITGTVALTAQYAVARFKSDGTNWWGSELQNIAVPACGDMNGYNVAVTVVIAATLTFVRVPSGLSGGINLGFTFQNARELKCNVPGTYLVNWSMSYDSTNSNQEIEGAPMLNNAALTTMAAHSEIINAAKPMTVAGTGIVALALNDVVALGVSNQTAIHNVIVEHATLSLLRIA